MISKIYRYRVLIFSTMYLLCKYMIVRAVFSDKKLLSYVSRPNCSESDLESNTISMQPIHSIIKSINLVLNYFYANGNCLIKCLVKRDLLRKYGFTNRILLGLSIAGSEIKAHAWLSDGCASEFKSVHLL